MYTPAQFENTRRHMRNISLENARLTRFHEFQKNKADNLEKVIREKDKILREKEKR